MNSHTSLYPAREQGCACVCAVAQSCPTLCDSMDCKPVRLLGPWDFLGKTTGVGCHFLLQGIFLTQGLNPHPLYCRGFFTTEPPVNHHYIPYWHEIPFNCQYLIPVFLVMVNIHLFSIRGTCFWKSLGGFCTLYHEGDTVYFLSVLFSCVDGVRKIPTIGEIWFRKKHDRRLRHSWF